MRLGDIDLKAMVFKAAKAIGYEIHPVITSGYFIMNGNEAGSEFNPLASYKETFKLMVSLQLVPKYEPEYVEVFHPRLFEPVRAFYNDYDGIELRTVAVAITQAAALLADTMSETAVQAD
ncbi:MAG: hypothetical protein ACTS9Y_00330 [Methylophilus sp.]|uniref:hypothetical protein n=1 Tax=Methylophilus sp. TaxID=29541 RepID=UPI003FA06D99